MPQPDPEMLSIEEAVVEVGKALARLRGSRLNDAAVLVLLADTTGLSRQTIRKVMDGMASLEARYLKKRA